MIAAIGRPAWARESRVVAQEVRIEPPGLLVDVEEDGLGARIGDCECRGAKRQGWDDHVVTGLDAQPHEPKVHRRGTGGQGQSVSDTGEGADVGFEPVHLRPKRGHPARCDCAPEGFNLQLRHVRLRQKHRSIRHGPPPLSDP